MKPEPQLPDGTAGNRHHRGEALCTGSGEGAALRENNCVVWATLHDPPGAVAPFDMRIQNMFSHERGIKRRNVAIPWIFKVRFEKPC